MKRNKIILLGAVILLVLLLTAAGARLAGFRYRPDIQGQLVADMMQSNAYKSALARLTENPALADRIGKPVKTGKILNLEAWENDSSGAIRLAQEVTGSRRSGIFQVDGVMDGGQWQYRECRVIFPDLTEWDLLKQTE